MRPLSLPWEPLRVRVAVRPWGLAALAAAVVGVALTADATVQSLQSSPSVPRARMAVLLSCLVASLAVAWMRPLLPLYEQMSGRPDLPHRFLMAVAVVGPALALIGVLAGGTRPVVTCAGFLGLALLAGSARPLLGITVPWVYAVAGLAFGYRTVAGGPAHLRPWAWMVGEGSTAPQVALCVAGIAAFALVGFRSAEGAALS